MDPDPNKDPDSREFLLYRIFRTESFPDFGSGSNPMVLAIIMIQILRPEEYGSGRAGKARIRNPAGRQRGKRKEL